MDLGFNLAPSNRDLKDPTSRQNFGDTSGLLCKNDPILRHKKKHLDKIPIMDGGGLLSFANLPQNLNVKCIYINL